MIGLNFGETANGLKSAYFRVRVLTDLVDSVTRDISRKNNLLLASIEEKVSNPTQGDSLVQSPDGVSVTSYPFSATFYNSNGSLKHMRELESDYIFEALRVSGGNVVEASKITELGYTTIYRKIKKYSLNLSVRNNGPKIDDPVKNLTLRVRVLTDLVNSIERKNNLLLASIEEKVSTPPQDGSLVQSPDTGSANSYPFSTTFYNADGFLKHMSELETDYIFEALRVSNWNVAKSSRLTGLGKSTIHRKIKNYSIKLPFRDNGPKINYLAKALKDNGWDVSKVSMFLGFAPSTIYRKIKKYDLKP